MASKGRSAPRKGFVLPDGTFPAGATGDAALAPETPQGASGHSDGPAARDPSWYQTGKGRLVIGTGALLVAAWAVKLLASGGIANWAFILAPLIGFAPIALPAINAARAGLPSPLDKIGKAAG